MPIDIIQKYFPGLTDLQQQQFAQFDNLYREWNAKINVISRKDIDNLYEHHILHSLAIAKVINFRPTTQILDFGTGGGFPGIPLAILFPECQFRLIDGTGKKIRVAQEVCQVIGLTNCQPVHLRGEDEYQQDPTQHPAQWYHLPEGRRTAGRDTAFPQHSRTDRHQHLLQ